MIKAHVLVLGARSDIGKAVAHAFAVLGHPLQLAARNVDTLADDKADIELRCKVDVILHEFDALAVGSIEAIAMALPQLPEIAIFVVGLLGVQDHSERNVDAAVRVLRSNYEGPATIMAVLANLFEERGHGTLVGISSVAGERRRASNYVYGSAKAGFIAFLSGLRNRLAKSGVHVVTVLPGFVARRMTEGMKLPPEMAAQPSEVADAIVLAIDRKKDVVHVRPLWRVIMTLIRAIPEIWFKHTNL